MIIRENINTGEVKEFKNNTQAAAELGMNESSVRKAIRDNKVVMNKYKFYNKSEETKLEGIKINKKLPKILILDIETSPLRAYVWRLWKQNISLSQTISNFFILTWSAKYLFGDTIMSERLTGQEALDEDDSRIAKKIWKLLNECDIVIAHNGDAFDFKKLNTRFILNGLPPTNYYKTIDTLLVAKTQFGFDSNSLNALASQFNLGEKIHTEFSLWDRCMKGEDSALEDMETYNCKDVELLEEVYLKLRPYIRNHPNLNLYMETDSPCCANCGSTNITEDSYYYTTANRFVVYRCECGALSRRRLSDMTKAERNKIILSLNK